MPKYSARYPRAIEPAPIPKSMAEKKVAFAAPRDSSGTILSAHGLLQLA